MNRHYAAGLVFALGSLLAFRFSKPFLGSFLYMIAALEKDGPDSDAYRSAAARQNLIGILFIVPLLLILYLMVFKPIT